MLVKLDYSSIISSNTTLIKSTEESILKEIQDTIKVLDVYYFDDGVEFRIYESDLDKAMETLDKYNKGCYSSRISRSPKSLKNLPDFEFRRVKLEEINHPKLRDKLSSIVEEVSEKINKNKIIVWKSLYKEFKEKHNIDIGEKSDLMGVKPINIIDMKNYYNKLFDILSSMS